LGTAETQVLGLLQAVAIRTHFCILTNSLALSTGMHVFFQENGGVQSPANQGFLLGTVSLLLVQVYSSLKVFVFLRVSVRVFFSAPGLKFRAACLLGKHSYHLSHSASPFFVLDFFEIGSLKELFAWDWLRTMILLFYGIGIWLVQQPQGPRLNL
jgi:hypothetical protein